MAFVAPTTTADVIRHRLCSTSRAAFPSLTTGSPRASLQSHTTVLLIPTGIGASIGGFAGDALPAARLLSSVTDTLITHPNVLNGALMFYPLPNAQYVEGLALDLFSADRLALRPLAAPSNRIGLVLDAAMPPHARLRHTQAADAARATLGLRVTHHVVTAAPLGVHLTPTAATSSAASWGTVRRPAELLSAVRKLVVDRRCCDAVALVAQFPDEDDAALAAYRTANGVDPIAGAEAVLSHLVTHEFSIPCAHAPSLPPLPPDQQVSPRACAEELGYTFLSCVLVGLSRAPRLIPREDALAGDIVADHVDVVIVPADAFGGAAIMALAARPSVLVIAVAENVTALRVPPQAVGIDPDRVLVANSYAEAAGFVAAHRAGIHIPSLTAQSPPLHLVT